MGILDYPVEAYKHNGDHDLMTSLGLRTWSFEREWLELGTVVVSSGATPATVKVEVLALPAQFFRFTIVRKSEGSDEDEVTVLKTGSGGFTSYWPTAKMFAENMITVAKEEA